MGSAVTRLHHRVHLRPALDRFANTPLIVRHHSRLQLAVELARVGVGVGSPGRHRDVCVKSTSNCCRLFVPRKHELDKLEADFSLNF